MNIHSPSKTLPLALAAMLCLLAALALGASPAYADNLSDAKAKYGLGNVPTFEVDTYSELRGALISDAQDIARDNKSKAIVHVKAGTYRVTDQGLSVLNDVVLVAEPGAKFVASSNITQILTVWGILYGGEFDGNGGKGYYCLRLGDTTFSSQRGIIEKATVKNSKRAGIMANGNSAGGKVIGCTVTNCGNTGISATEGGKLALVDGCTVANNTRSGVNLSGGSSITTVSNCTIRNNEGHGISTDSTDKRAQACKVGTVKGCTITGNGRNGIWVDSYCSIGSIEGCTIDANKNAGVSVIHHASATLANSTVSGHEASNLYAKGTSSVMNLKSGNIIRNGKTNNITLEGKSKITMSEGYNQVLNSGAAGVSVKPNASFTMTGTNNKISGNKTYGVRVENGGSASLQNCDLTGNTECAAYIYQGGVFKYTNCGSIAPTTLRSGNVMYDAYSAPVQPAEKPIVQTDHWKRLYGDTALDTMESIVKQGFSKSDVVVIATSADFYDALAASALAGKYNAPVLLTSKTALSAQTAREIKRLGAKTAYITGGTAAITKKTENQIKAALSGSKRIVRCAGDTAIGTAEKIAAEVGGGQTCVIATSRSFHDALAASPYAYVKKAPIFLTDTSGRLTESTKRAIAAGGFKNALIAGGTAVVPKATQDVLVGMGMKVVRKSGDNAYGTAAEVAKWCLQTQGMLADGMGVATGTGYWDALTGAALCGSKNAVLVLADPKYSTGIDEVVQPYGKSIKQGYIFGGTVAVPNVVMRACETAAANGGNKVPSGAALPTIKANTAA